ncbi:MAG: hypothetical protein MPJ83_01025 [Gammaproteobacteria bacterium]|nr:hypothetical protein [Gammaproteobacteria bacterium]
MKKTSGHSKVAETLCSKGDAFVRDEDFKQALETFRAAIEADKSIVLEHPLCQIAYNVNTTDGFKNLVKVLGAVYEIKQALIWSPSEHPEPISHYTGLKALKNLVEGGKFRLYNADYMNDREEGNAFWDFMDGNTQHDPRAKIHSHGEKKLLSPAYVGSFFREKHGSKDGELFLWRTYGKNAEVEAAGACIYFDISKFSDTPPVHFGRMRFPEEPSTPHAQLGWMLFPEEPSTRPVRLLWGKSQLLWGDSQSRLVWGSVSGKKSRPDSSPLQTECLYRVVYASEIRPDEKGKIHSAKNEDLYKSLLKLAEKLDYIADNKWESDEEEKNVYRMTRELLDEIRFLFKADDYRGEQELRIVQSHYTSEQVYSDEHDAENETSDIKPDVDHFPPRLYREVKSLGLQAVTLGPIVPDVLEWMHWLNWKKSDLEIHHSKISYGQKSL